MCVGVRVWVCMLVCECSVCVRVLMSGCGYVRVCWCLSVVYVCVGVSMWVCVCWCFSVGMCLCVGVNV